MSSSIAPRPTITTALVRVCDLKAQDVALLSVPHGATKRWRHVYDVEADANGEQIIENLLVDGETTVKLASVVKPFDVRELDDRDVLIRVARDEDRTEGPGVFQDAWLLFYNPNDLVEIQVEHRPETEEVAV